VRAYGIGLALNNLGFKSELITYSDDMDGLERFRPVSHLGLMTILQNLFQQFLIRLEIVTSHMVNT
jgi:hypothetical protein